VCRARPRALGRARWWQSAKSTGGHLQDADRQSHMPGAAGIREKCLQLALAENIEFSVWGTDTVGTEATEGMSELVYAIAVKNGKSLLKQQGEAELEASNTGWLLASLTCDVLASGVQGNCGDIGASEAHLPRSARCGRGTPPVAVNCPTATPTRSPDVPWRWPRPSRPRRRGPASPSPRCGPVLPASRLIFPRTALSTPTRC
jgi:hypothetical protein